MANHECVVKGRDGNLDWGNDAVGFSIVSPDQPINHVSLAVESTTPVSSFSLKGSANMAPKDVLDLEICVVRARADVMLLTTRLAGSSSAGMGGLATALALAKQGFRHINVYESASTLSFVGAGIQLAPNMARNLDLLGV